MDTFCGVCPSCMMHVGGAGSPYRDGGAYGWGCVCSACVCV